MLRLDHERRAWLLTFVAAGLPSAALLIVLWLTDVAPALRRPASVVLPLACWAFAAAARRRVAYPLQTLANLLEAMREGDFSLRARSGRDADALGEVMREVNALASTLRHQRLGAREATALLRRVMEEIDVAVFAFDEERRLRLANRAAERLLGRPAERLVGLEARDLDLDETLEGESVRTFQAEFAGGRGPWALRRSTFREGGAPQALVVLADLSRALREEERQAWQRLVRVLGHELNNSLTPIRSMAATLRTLLARAPRPGDWEEDMERGLEVIGDRADSLGRFVGAYGQLARLPKPLLAPVDVASWVRRVVALERRLAVQVEGGPAVALLGDGDQLDQLLINLVRNAVDAALETGGGVRVRWSRVATGPAPRTTPARTRGPGRGELPARVEDLVLEIEDDGHGPPPTGNLFVPFFTTKPGGTGIGLALSRQIAEAHQGSLALEARTPSAPPPPAAAKGSTETARATVGAVARLRLPLPLTVIPATTGLRQDQVGGGGMG